MYLMKISVKLSLLIISIFITAMLVAQAGAFQKDGCGTGECVNCHSLSKPEAEEALKGVVEKVLSVRMSEVPGLWEVDVFISGKKLPFFLDFSLQYVINGMVMKLDTKENLTRKKFLSLNTVDRSKIPLDDALVIGDAEAANKIIVFDDPECSFCKKLHPEMKKVVSENKDIAFFIKMFPLKSHEHAYDKAKAIVCDKSLALLEDSLNGKALPKPSCETDAIDRNIALAGELFISSTPTLIFPDGLVVPGYKDADYIVQITREKRQ